LPPHRRQGAADRGRILAEDGGDDGGGGGDALGPGRHAVTILEPTRNYRNDRTVVLAGGVGGARMAQGFAAVLPGDALTVVVNVGDDATMYGVHVAADLDTVVYTLAGINGAAGWGIRDDTFAVVEGLGRLGRDTTFRLGDRDLATCLARTLALGEGRSLSSFTRELTAALGVAATVLPASDDPVRTRIHTPAGTWLDFQEYFVLRGHSDDVAGLDFAGAAEAHPAPGVLEALRAATRVVVAPSNPPLSIWPILAVPGIRDAVAACPRVIGVSPLIGGRALKGPADRVMDTLGLPPGNAGVVAAYDGLLTHLFIDRSDAADTTRLQGVEVAATDTRIAARERAAVLAEEILAVG
jgi:LPPG:FO 2-phospho-L-lactate transferase